MFSPDMGTSWMLPAVATRRCELRVVALNNDREGFGLALKEKPPGMVAARHEENSKMFELFFNDPRFARVLAEYLGEAYAGFRGSVGALIGQTYAPTGPLICPRSVTGMKSGSPNTFPVIVETASRTYG